MNLMALCLGACAGALARWALTQALNTPGAWLPWGTLAANLAGGLLAGVALAAFERWPGLDPAWRLAVMTGFLGALTTFSGFGVEIVHMLQTQRWLAALATAALHTLGVVGMVMAGLKLARLLLF